MSRLYDRLKEHAKNVGGINWANQSILKSHPTVICADNVGEWYFVEKGANGLPLQVIPPFNDCFIEMKRPVDWKGFLPKYFGFHILVNREEETTVLQCSMYFEERRDGMNFSILAGPVAICFVTCSRSGDWLDDEVVIPEGSYYHNLITDPRNRNAESRFKSQEEYIESVQTNAIAPALIPTLYAISFMNCKNIEIIDNTPPPKLNKKREKRGDIPLVTYKTLNIKPETLKHYTQPADQTSPASNPRDLPLHIVRGTFADYRHGKGLFGKEALKGIYWKPSHVRGDIDNGAVVKDYNVLPK